VLAALLLAAAGSALARDWPAPPIDLGPLPDFALTGHTGRAVTRADLLGSVWIADFIFTRCAGQCPLLSGRMAALQERFAEAPGVRLVSFTVDPDYDTAERLAAYAAHWGAREGRWDLLTGPKEAVRSLILTGFQLAVSDEGTPEEPIAHSVRLALVDAAGRRRGYYDATDEQAMERLYHDARALAEPAPAEAE
jgi:protein SCO1/2